MSLFYLCRMGLLVDETFTILSSLSEDPEWKLAEENLFFAGLTSSKNRAYELRREIQKRILNNNKLLPSLDDLILLNQLNIPYSVKKEILFIYLCDKDNTFKKMVGFLKDIDNASDDMPIITRNEILSMFVDYHKSINKKPKEKTIINWIGRFLSILRDVQILIPMARNKYHLNFGIVHQTTWIFFTLHSFFNKQNIIDSPFFEYFNLRKEKRIKRILSQIENKNIKYELIKEKKENIIVELHTTYKNLKDWIKDLQC